MILAAAQNETLLPLASSLSPLDISPHAAHAVLIVFTESSRRKWKTLCEREEYNSPAH
jgi:hypothetical protein